MKNTRSLPSMSPHRTGTSTVVLLFGVLTFLASTLVAQVRPAPQPPAFAGRPGADYIIAFQPGTSRADRAAAVRSAGALLRFNYTIVNAAAVTVPNENALAALQRVGLVASIIPDRRVQAIQSSSGRPPELPSAPGQDKKTKAEPTEVVPEGVKRVGEPTETSNGAGIGVAIVDTGIDLEHADLAPAAESYSAYGGSCDDGDGHGTHVAGIVGALQGNSTDVVGVAPQATLYCVKVLDNSGSGTDSTVMAGLEWIADNWNNVSPPIRVVNMSLGREGSLDDNPALRLAVQALQSAGLVIVVSAGNDALTEVSQHVPATYPEVFAIASTTAVEGARGKCRYFRQTIPADTASYFTTDGKFVGGIGVTISAPGEEAETVNSACYLVSNGILSLKAGGGTTRMSGTSMAAPHVSGIVARMMQAGQSVPENIRTVLQNNADRRGTAPLDSPASNYSFDEDREGIAQALP